MNRIVAALAATALLAGTATAQEAGDYIDWDAKKSEPVWIGPLWEPRHTQSFTVTAARYLRQEHGSRFPHPAVVSVDLWPFRKRLGRETIHAQAAVASVVCRISYSYATAHSIRQIMRHHAGQRVPLRPVTATVVLHELLHCVNPKAPEGLVDAVAADLTPSFLRWYLGRGVRVDQEGLVNYPDAMTYWLRTARASRSSVFSPKAATLRYRMLEGWKGGR